MKLFSYLILSLLGLAMIGCTQPKVDPMSLSILEGDRVEVEFPPSDEELMVQPRLMLPLIVYQGATVTAPRLAKVMAFLQDSFRKQGNFDFIAQEKIHALLKKEKNRRFQTNNVADAIELGLSQDATFVGQLEIKLIESKLVKGVDRFKAVINLGVLTTNTGQVVFKQDIYFNSANPKASQKKLKKMVQENFPMRGYILETRGGHEVARISLGRGLGLAIGRELLIRNRIQKIDMVGGLVRKRISFDPEAVAQVRVIKIMEDEAWVWIEEKDRAQIKLGQVVFTQPEKGIWH